jgi:hypothetical protein
MRRALGLGLVCLALVSDAGCTGAIKTADDAEGPSRSGRRGPNGELIDPETGLPVPGTGSDSPAGDEPGDDDPGSVDDDPAVVAACEQLDVGVTPLRRLTRSEYDRTVADLLGDTSAPAEQFAPDEKLLGFDAGLNVSRLLAEQYMNAAEALAVAATADMPKLLGCDPAVDGEDTCVHEFIASFGRRAYRRPLDSEEETELRTFYATAKTEHGFGTAVSLMLQAMLQSPDFLYRVELGTATAQPAIVQLTGHEIASRLSYFFWGTTPTPDLLAAAEAGELEDAADIEQRAREMLDDPRSHATVASFHRQWLDLELLDTTGKDPEVYPGFDDTLREAMRDETLRFAEYIVFEDDGSVQALLTSPFTFINAPLAEVYGQSGDFDETLARTDLAATERMGLLTHASVLSVHAKSNQSSPVHRGKFVRERLLCQQLSPPPAGLVIVPPDPDPDASTRERFAQHSEDDSCSGCHALMDPIGFGFEHYDGIGRYREMDGTFTVDASGQINSSRDADGPFDGALELAQRLAQSEEVNQCVAGQWFVYAFGRSVNNELDRCSRERLYSAFAASGHRIPELLVALTGTNAFRYRRMAEDGGTP